MKWIPILPLAELPLGASTSLSPTGVPCEIGVFHTSDGIFAIENTCPHHEASLCDGPVKEGVVYCPMHFWRFRLRDGFAYSGPQFHLRTFQVRVEDDHIWLNLEAMQLEE